jgi:hypothetical protein
LRPPSIATLLSALGWTTVLLQAVGSNLPGRHREQNIDRAVILVPNSQRGYGNG